MSFGPADFAGFGGLNLAADAEDSPGALDLLNVNLSNPGPSRLTARPGYTLAGTLGLGAMTGIVVNNTSDGSVIMGEVTALRLISAAGTQTAAKTNFASANGSVWTILRYGNPATETVAAATNPSFDSGTTGWTPTGSAVTRDTGDYDTTPASLRWDNTGGSDALTAGDSLSATFTGTFFAGVHYQLKVRIKASAAVNISAYWGLQSSGDVGFDTWTTTTSYATYTVGWTPTNTHTSGVTLLLGAAGAYFRIDTVTVEQLGVAYGCSGSALGRLNVDSTFDVPLVATQAAGATAYTAGRTAPVPYTLAVQPKDNRLVAWGFAAATYGPNGAASSSSHAYFSQPDNPEKYDETDYVVLSPGDGETGRAAATYNDFLLLFKQSKFFVFYGNSTDSTGGTVFNYRTVGNAFGGSSSAIYQGQVCSAPSGVYVITDTGVWKTTGSAPVLVSPGLSPLFNQNVSTLAYQGTGYTKLAPRSATGSGGSFWHQGKVYFSVTITRSTATTSSGWLVLDEQSGQWTVWEFADSPTIGASMSSGIVFPSGSGTTGRKGLLSMDGTATTDNGTAIASYYTSPYLTYGEAKAEKHVRASELHGTGTVTLAWGKDLQTHGTAETVAMSSGIGHARTGARGRVLSFKIAASAAGWTVNRVVPLLQAVRTGK